MMDARNYSARETLRDGLEVTIRAIRPDDRDALLAAFLALDPKSIRLRFFGPKKDLSDRELAAATDVDFVRIVALVTCIHDGAGERIIGAGRYVATGDSDPPDQAEVAFTVEEDYQGLGIASRILRHLAGIAVRTGITRFEAEVLPENAGMLAVFERSGFPVQQKTADGIVHVTLSLSGGTQ